MWTWLQLFLMNCNKFRVIVFSRINMIFTDLEEIFTMGNLTTLSFAISLWQTVPCYYSNSILFINFSLESPRENFFFQILMSWNHIKLNDSKHNTPNFFSVAFALLDKFRVRSESFHYYFQILFRGLHMSVNFFVLVLKRK